MFKEKFKYYKQRSPVPKFTEVLDFANEDALRGKATLKPPIMDYDPVLHKSLQGFFKPISEWKIYEIKEKQGVIFLKNPWTALGQRYWIARCLSDYTKKPNKLNLDVFHKEESKELEDWWVSATRDEFQCGVEKGYMKRLRWATLGYHHNWDTKVYSEDDKTEFPRDLWLINRYIAGIVGGWNDYNAQAAIVNFYYPESTLSGHQDKSEHNMTAPLLSFSFGLTALFLIGGRSIDEIPVPMFLDSGDVVIMFGKCRESYHAVPRIMTADIRRVPDDCYNDFSHQCSINRTSDVLSNDFNFALLKSVIDNENYWKPFRKYMCNSRINMNVRQVLNKDENKLPT